MKFDGISAERPDEEELDDEARAQCTRIATLEGKLEVMYGEVHLKLETAETHGTCPFCA